MPSARSVESARTCSGFSKSPQKLCYYANSGPCSEDDPEFVRIVEAFRASNYNYRSLVVDLFSSPLVTQASRTKTFTDLEQPVGISRREHFCVALSNRLGLSDICGLDAVTLTTVQNNVNRLSLSLPEASYSRGAESPTTARDPNLFFRAGVENLCRLVADQVVDMGTTPRYSSTNSMAAIDDFVKTVMALPPADMRSAPARQILLDHYNAALTQSGIMPRDALKSTFVLACSSPTSVSIGL